MSISDLCTTFINSSQLKDDTERNIIEFSEAPWGLGLGSVSGVPPLYPVQKFIFKCYYNLELNNNAEHNIIVRDRFNEKERYRFNEYEYLQFLRDEGRINIKETTGRKEDTRPNLLLVIGRRGTKTTTIGVIVCFETYQLLKKVSPQEYYNIMPDDEIRVTCIATAQEQSSELFRRITGHLERSEYFKKYRNKPTQSFMLLNTQRDIEQYGGDRSSIRIVAAPCSARGLRSPNNIMVIFDELAHFFEEGGSDKADEAVYEAVTPSIARFNAPDGTPHGKVISISSPHHKSGKFFKLYERSMDPDCADLLMIQAPSWEVDYTLSPKYLRSKYAEGPVSYNSEFGAKFSDRITAWIENEELLRINIIPGLRLKEKSYERIPHFMGIDVGLKNDGTAIAITHIVNELVAGEMKSFIVLDYIAARYAHDEGKDFFKPDEMAEWILEVLPKFYIVEGMMDQYYGLALIPMIHDKGFKQVQAVNCSRDFNSKVYQNLMVKMLDTALRIPEDKERIVDGKKTKDLDLITELLKLRATSYSKYIISVEAPEIKGVHDDLSDAFARSVYCATKYMAGGSVVNKRVETVSKYGSASYKKYYAKQKQSVLYTKRPSSGLQLEMSRQRNIGGVGRLGNSLERRSGRW